MSGPLPAPLPVDAASGYALRMIVECNIEEPLWEATALEARAERAARATLEHLSLDPDAYAISLLGCNDARIAALNADFRGKPAPTNVLSWPSGERDPADPPRPAPGAEPEELGDIAIAFGTCTREAGAAGIPVGDHASHLIVHAILHLLGHDHEADDEAALMEATERSILGDMGLHDPYS